MPKFLPKKSFTLYQPGTHFGNQSKDSVFISEQIKQHIDFGGVIINIYRLEGTHDQQRDMLGVKKNRGGTVQDTTQDVGSFLGVQDTILNENRDRRYNFTEIPQMKCVYTVSQNELDYAKYGMGLAGDVLTLEFHVQTLETMCGRRLMPGDVVEMTHLREVGLDGRVANKWYEVSNMAWSPSGYDPLYMRHVMGYIVRPMRDQQEFYDILKNVTDDYGRTVKETNSNADALLAVNEANQKIANEHAYTTWHDTTIMYFDPDRPNAKPYRWNDDATPPNGIPVEQGSEFPSNPADGAWYVRTDMVPNKLYYFTGGRWRLREEDIKRDWQPYNWVVKMREFMSDRSEEDRQRNWKLRSIHDVITDREDRSDPSGEEV